VSARITQRTDGSQTSFATSSAGTFTIRTDDPLLSHTTVPMATVMLGFGKQSGLRARSTTTPLPRRAAIPPRVEERAADPAGSAESAGDLPAEASVAGSVPETGRSDTSTDHAHQPTRAERRQRLLEAAETPAASEEPEEPLEPEAAATEPVAAEAADPAPDQESAEHAQPSSEQPAHPHRLEMTIDSLPHHELTEPIPIVIDPLGDTIFTATISNLDICATGNSIGEGMVLLKEQIEFVYGDLSRRSNLTPDQKTTLQILHTYIRPNGPKKPEWF
jgi:hypothetical protein